MDFTLRCNSLKCRGQLNDRAVVTTCSHIFCVSCSDTLGLSNAAGGVRICPACETHLNNADDAVVAQLNPSEDYKTSVLSGLSPGIIMECAGRGLAFYSYQTTQEIVYQEFLAKSLTDKYTTLSTQMDKIIHDANSEITNLRNKLSAMQIDQETLQQRNHELVEQVRDRTRKQQQAQQMYQNLKKQAMETHAQLAASDAVEQTLQSATNNRQRYRNAEPQFNHFPVDHRGIEQIHSRQRSGSSGDDGRDGGRTLHTFMPGGQGFGNSQGNGIYSSRNIFDLSYLIHDELADGKAEGAPVATPQQRTRLPVAQHSALPSVYANVIGQNGYAPASQACGQPSTRRPLGNLNPNVVVNPGITGYGMSAGMKVGRQAGPLQGAGIPKIGRMGGGANAMMH